MHTFSRFLLCFAWLACLGAVDVTITSLNTNTVNLADSDPRMLEIEVLSGTGEGLEGTELVLTGGGSLSGFAGSGPTYFVTWTPPTNAEGTATITVPAGTIIGGNNQGQITIPYDLVAPGTPTLTGLTEGDTIGASRTVTGPVPTGATTVEVNGVAATIASGVWSRTLTSLTTGPLAITVRAIDALDNDASTTINVTVDATPPGLAVTTPSGTVNHGSTTLTVEGTCDDPTATITIVDGAVTTPVTYASNWSVELTSLSQGVHNLQIRAVDTYGNLSTVNRAVTVDITQPSVSLGTPSATLARLGDQPTIAVTFADAGVGLDTVSFSDTDVTVTTTGSASADPVVDDLGDSDLGTWRITLTNLSGDGTVRVSVAGSLALDLVGNASPASALSAAVTVDNTAPSVTSVTPNPGVTSTNPTVAVTITLNQAAASMPVVVATNASASAVSLVSGSTYTVTLTATDPGTFGIVSIDAEDAAGNTMSDSTGWTVGTYQTGIAGSFGLPVTQEATTSVSPIVFEITFAEAIDVATFTAGDLVVGGTAGGTKIVTLTADAVLDDTVFYVSVSGMTTSGTVSITLPGDRVQAALGGEYNATLNGSSLVVTWNDPTPPPPPSSGGSSTGGGGGGGGGCSAGAAAGLIGLGLIVLGFRRRRM